MGRVWVAREQGLVARPRLVAIKTALAEEAASEEYWKVLLDEARIASMIQHPNVCSIHALDRERGVVYLVMDWSDGGSLRELLDELPTRCIVPTVAARIVAHVCAGLQAAHELVGDDGQPLHVVHRDVSPQNILISANGQVKITDFGVAKARGQIHAPTQTGEVKGKLSYMAPEQVTTRDVDRRADVFALGCVLYEASTGARPFHGSDALATLYQLLEQPIKPPSELSPDYPRALERIVLKALERDPEARYQTTEEMGRALQAWLAQERAMVADSDIASLVSEALGERVSARARAVEAALQAMDAPAEAATHTPLGIETLSGSAASTLPGSPVARPSRNKVWRAALAAATVGLSVVIALAARSSATNAPAAQPAHAVATATPAPVQTQQPAATTPVTPPQSDVTIRVRTEPPEAELSIDDGPPVTNPFVLTRAPDAKPHRIKARLAGFTGGEETLSFDKDRELVITLARASATANTPKHPVVKTPVVTAPPTAASASEAQPPSHEHGVLPPVIGRKPRTLDSSNPFAQGE